MLKEYVIDGNNLIGKVASLKAVQKNNPQLSREKLVNMLLRYFIQKRCKAFLFFDGFEKDKIASGDVRIIYSNKKDADSIIKEHINHSKNPKHLIIVSSDGSVAGYARKNACQVISAEEFGRELQSAGQEQSSGENNHNLQSQNDYFIKLFNAK